MNEAEIEAFWERFPVGHRQVSGFGEDALGFFDRYDAFRYRTERHILACLDALPLAGKRVLEIGLGQGADSEQLIRRGARWSGIDLTPTSVERVRRRLELRGLPFDDLRVGSATAIPFEDHSFDIVFSHGVLHHVPDIHAAQREIHRVVRTEGELIVMLYARWSLNYVVAIGILRRLGLLALWATGRRPGGIAGRHLEQARAIGIWRYLRMDQFIHRNTDGPDNPYSKVYDLATVRRDFPDFEIIRAYKRHMHAPPLPVEWLPLERFLGWHLWVHLRPRAH